MNECPDSDLASRAAAGDRPAFDALVERWEGRVFRLVHRFFPRSEAAEDVAQDAFVKAWRGAGRLPGRRAVRALAAQDRHPLLL